MSAGEQMSRFPLERLEEPYVLSSQYRHPLKGNEVRLYLRGYDPFEHRHRSTFLDLAADYAIPSEPLSTMEADNLVDALRNDPVLQNYGYHFFFLPDNTGHSVVIQARTPDKQKTVVEELGRAAKRAGFPKHTFLWSRFSPATYLQATFQPLGLLNLQGIKNGYHQEGYYTDRGTVALQHLVNDVHLIIDLETENWDKPDLEDIISLVIVTPTVDRLPSVLFTRYDPPADEIGGAQIRRFKDHADLGHQLESYIAEVDPLGFVGYNLRFDFIQQLRRVCPDIRLGLDDSPIRVRASGGRTQSHRVGGRFVHDLFLLASQQMSYLSSQKLDALTEHLGTGEKKRYNYFELAQALRDKDVGAYLYTAEDGEKTRDLFNTLKEEIYRDATFLRLVPEACEKSFASASETAFKVWTFRHRNTVASPKRPVRRRDQFDPDAEERLWYGVDHLPLKKGTVLRDRKHVLTDGLEYPRQRGFFQDAAWFHPTLLVKAFEPLYRASHYHQLFWKAYRDHDLVKHRYRGLWKLREMILRDVIAYQDSCLDFGLEMTQPFPAVIPDRTNSAGKPVPFDSYNWFFRLKHGHEEVDLWELNRSVSETVAEWQSLFSEDAWLNYSKGFLLVRGPEARSLAEKRLGVILAEGGAVSNGSFFAMRNNKTLYVEGAQICRRDKPRWAWELMHDLLLEACDQAGRGVHDRGSLETLLQDAANAIDDGRTRRSELLFNEVGGKTRSSSTLFDDAERAERHQPRIVGLFNDCDANHEEFLASNRRPDAARYVHLFRHKWYAELVSFLLKGTEPSLFS